MNDNTMHSDLAAFLAERTLRHDRSVARLSEFAREFYQWSIDRQLRPWKRMAIQLQLQRAGYVIGIDPELGVLCIAGLSLRSPVEWTIDENGILRRKYLTETTNG